MWHVLTYATYLSFCVTCREKPNQVLVHVRMLEKSAQSQAEALGILGGVP